MLAFLKHSNDLDFAAAIAYDDAWSLVGVTRPKSGKLELSVCEWVDLSSISDGQKRMARLKSKIREHRLDQNGLATVLGLGEYTLLSIESPQVPPNEIRAAIRWQIRDLIDFHIDDAVVDVFDAPQQSTGQQKNIYVVISRKKSLEERIHPLQQIDVNLTVVDVPELVLRNIAMLLEENESGMVMLHFSENLGLLTLVQKNTLFLARALDVGYRQLSMQDPDTASDAVDHVCLEIQRSLDYFDRYFGKAPIRHAVISPLQDICPQLCALIQQQLDLSVRFFSFEDIVTSKKLLSAEQQRRNLFSLGAALRLEQSAL